MRIGVFGGTFDPPHNGHLALAEGARESLELDEVLFVPARRNPLKADRPQSSASQRLQMVALAVEDVSGFTVSDIETRRYGPSYMVDTLTQLQMTRSADYWLLLGADALRRFKSWKQPGKILRICRLGVAVRASDSFEDILSRATPALAVHIDRVSMPTLNVSGTEIRHRISQGLPVAHWVSHKVIEYIERHHLYGS